MTQLPTKVVNMGRKHETYVSGHSELNAYERTILHYHLIINHRLNYFKIIILKVNKLIIHNELLLDDNIRRDCYKYRSMNNNIDSFVQVKIKL